jgi:dipeptide/tripeptide permease
MSYASELNAWSVGFEAAGVSSHIGFAIRVICSLRLETIGAVN